VSLDSTIVNVALKTLAEDFRVPLTTIQWTSTGYLLALAVMVPITGWAQRRLGGKTLWLTALVVFLAGSVAAALAPQVGWLIAATVVQGAGGAVLMTTGTTILVRAAGGRGLGQLMATIGLPIMVVPIFGPLVGGLILAQLSWRFIFWLNLPFCVVGFLLALRFVPPEAGRPSERLDLAGLVMAGGGAAAVLFGLSQTARAGLGAAVAWGPLAGGLAALVGFVGWSLRGARQPILDLRLFRRTGFAVCAGAVALIGFAQYAAMLLIPLYYQNLRSTTALGAGVALIPQGLGTLVTRSAAGKLTDRIGAGPVVAVCAGLALAGTIPFALVGPDTAWWVLALWLVVRGAGLGGLFMPAMAALYQGLPRADVDSASAIGRLTQQIGGAFGAAVAAIILTWRMDQGATTTDAYHWAFWAAAGFTALILVATPFLPRAKK
jgi:EmrB/QacA subfamily drug resistance transporter